ncbi:MAG: glycerol-3-phosphate dehydrogenase/oxidase [Pseudomonadota bacterium]
MSGLDATARESLLAELCSQEFDLVVIGGGITGAGILRDAALRGLRVALLESQDFSSGTSSKSTKLIHGGIRYLAMGHVHVVREAALERKRVHTIAPHLAEPTWLMLPARSRLEFLKYKAGVMAYEVLGQVSTRDRHFDLSGAALHEYEPLIDVARYPRASVYREYLTDDSRLVLANIRAGIEAGGLAANRLAVTGIEKQGARAVGVRARCGLTGAEIVVRGKGVINAAGPWVEDICRMDGGPPQKSLVLSKGVHIVVSRARLPLRRMVMTVTRDRRPVFLIPRGDVVYIGTTDSQVPAAEAWPSVSATEMNYLFEPVSDYCGVALSASDCLSTWAGLRPLILQSGKSTREISRKDEIWISDSGLITIAGGKLTGYRKMAEDTVDEACRLLGFHRPEPTADTPLPGGDFTGTLERLALDLMQTWPMPEERARRLVKLYGRESREILAFGDKPVVDNVDIVEGEVRWAITREGANSLEDILYRRTRAVYYSPEQVERVLAPIARLAAISLDWSDEVRAEQTAATRDRLASDLACVRSTG